MSIVGPYVVIDYDKHKTRKVVLRRNSICDMTHYNVWEDCNSDYTNCRYWHSLNVSEEFDSEVAAKQDLDKCLIKQGITIIDDVERWQKLKLLL